jgi:type I restriction enzyme S subunit
MLSDIGRIVTGKTPSSQTPEMFGQDYPFLTPSDIDGIERYVEPARFLSEQGYTKQIRLLLPKDTVCVVCIGATIGKVCMTSRPSFSNQQINSVVVDASRYDPRFVYYLLTTLRDDLKAKAGGAATPIINKSAFSEVAICVPDLEAQIEAANVLAAYDELIENNQRRIRILEEMARRLYREWFVHFRFPGHENHPRVPSSLGEIPQGWEVKRLQEITSLINRGISPRYEENGESVVVNQKCIRDQKLSFGPARRQSKPIPREKLIRYGDVLINSTGVGTLGRVAQVYNHFDRVTVDSHVTIVRPHNDLDVDFFGCSLLNLEPEFERLGVGATGQTELSRTAVGNTEVIVPLKKLQIAFGKKASAMRAAQVLYATQIENLRRTRDLLLPRLLSGQIELEAN